MSSDQGNGNIAVEDDCPICLEPLPPFWDLLSRRVFICCGKYVCKNCYAEKMAYLDRAAAVGSFGKAEKQLGSRCPHCRTNLPDAYKKKGPAGLLVERFDKGRLELSLFHQLGTCYVNGWHGLQQNIAKGNEILMRGAERGDPICQHNLGIAYSTGTFGMQKSPEEAKRWLLAASEQGHAVAEHDLAVMSRDEGNDIECLRYLRGSAAKGFNGACHNLGRAIVQGQYGLQQPREVRVEEAIRVLTPAAERGDPNCMNLLGSLLCHQASEAAGINPNKYTRGLLLMRRADKNRGGGDTITGHPRDHVSQLGGFVELVSNKCFNCNKEVPPENDFLRCSRCRAAWYCSKDCQVQHWKAEGGHKQCCIKWE